jgi:hypothetical protein
MFNTQFADLLNAGVFEKRNRVAFEESLRCNISRWGTVRFLWFEHWQISAVFLFAIYCEF